VGPLTPGQSTSYQCSVSNVTADFTNTATATGTPPTGPNVTDDDDAVVDATNPDIGIDKQLTSPAGGVTTTGNLVTFTVEVSNTGDTVLDIVEFADTWSDACLALQSVTPNAPPPDSAFCVGGGACGLQWDNIGPLAVGQSKVFTFTFLARYNPIPTIPPTLPDCSPTTNFASASGTDENGDPVGPVADDADVNIFQPGIEIAKTPDVQQVVSGGTVTFTIRVTNTGDVTLTNVTVSDPLALNCAATVGTLSPGATQSYQCSLINVTADFTNTATVTATPPVGPDVTDSDDAVVEVQNLDFGDAPDPTYPTLLASNGARHIIVPGISLNLSAPDGELDGIPNATATGDDITNIDDENGVNIPLLTPGSLAFISLSSSVSGFLNAWIDFNDDGDWNDLGEQIATNANLLGGVSILPVAAPSNAVPGTTYARFRFSTQQNLAPTGLAQDGEVEDYLVTIAGGDYAIDKQLMTQEPVRTGDLVSFTIRITNTGVATITQLPLRDTYDVNYLSFSNATPASDDNANDGQIDWSDLTVSFGQDLAPGQSFVVVVEFVARLDTTGLLPDGKTGNVATGVNVTADPDGPGGQPPQTIPDKSDEARVEINNPTAVGVSDGLVQGGVAGLTVRWRTANETDLAGFRVYRQVDGGSLTLLTPELIQAQRSGQAAGAEYSFADAEVGVNVLVRYVLEIVTLDGASTQVEIGSIYVAQPRMYLPLVAR
jgi:uncharacterized repeat protein (TIGR01451 family)